MSTFMGLSFDAWADIYKLYVHEKGLPPADLWELRKFWRCQPFSTPGDALRITLKLVAADKIDSSPVVDMLEAFAKTQAHNQAE